MKISFIVCCYNSEKRISKTLNAIFKAASQSEVNCELIVVNNCSTDNTHEIVESIINKAIEIDAKLVNEVNPGLMSARLRGAEELQDYLAFIDDDNSIADNWLLEAKMQLKHLSAGIIGGLALCGYMDLPIWFEDSNPMRVALWVEKKVLLWPFELRSRNDCCIKSLGSSKQKNHKAREFGRNW